MNNLEKRMEEAERKIAVLTQIIEERLGIKIDFRDDVACTLAEIMIASGVAALFWGIAIGFVVMVVADAKKDKRK